MKFMTNADRKVGKYFLMGAAVAAAICLFVDAAETIKTTFGMSAMAIGAIFGDIRTVDKARANDYIRLQNLIANLEAQLKRLRIRG